MAGDIVWVRDFFRSEAPLCWRRRPSMSEIALQANRLGISQQSVAIHLVLEVPNTPLGRTYQAHTLRYTRPGRLGVMVTAQAEFERGGSGVGRLADFEYAMATQGRPCHFAFVFGEKSQAHVDSGSSEDM
jgi:hypothetical protein